MFPVIFLFSVQLSLFPMKMSLKTPVILKPTSFSEIKLRAFTKNMQKVFKLIHKRFFVKKLIPQRYLFYLFIHVMHVCSAKRCGFEIKMLNQAFFSHLDGNFKKKEKKI